ncbi:MAG: TonB-dependent receptor [Ignavibacteriae bacterium]|nr:TonB-dependent receptor [Ignavibacteriota bacterium]
MWLSIYFSKRKLISLFCLTVFFVLQTVVSAQTGNIKGKILDQNSSETLLGSNISIKGTSLGAASDLEGNYIVRNIPVGQYTIEVSYIGYISKTLEINIIENRTIEQDFYLEAKTIEGETVTVTGQASGQLEAINRQLTSNTITNVVSSEQIRELPDDNAATALSRLPGVSLMNGDEVVIRGMESKLNQVLINGIQLPSTNMETRSTNLGFISSSMISSIEVVKAITPDMDANTIGGVVNLKLMEAPADLHFDVLTQGNYNYSDRNYNNYKFWGSVSNRFFDNKFGVFLQANADRSDGGNQTASIGLTRDGSSNLAYGQSAYFTNSANFGYGRSIVDIAGGSLLMDYKLPNGKIILQNTYAGNFTDQRNNIIGLDFDGTDIHYTVDRNKFGRDLWINALQAENSFGDLKVEASLAHSSTNQYTRNAYSPWGSGNGWTDFNNETGFDAPFGVGSDGLPIRYTGTAQAGITLQRAYAIFDNINPSDPDSATLEGWVSSIKNRFNQHLYNGSFDVSKPVNFSTDITATFKAGGKYVKTTRVNDFNRTYTGSSDDDTYNRVEDFFPIHRDAENRMRLTDVLDDDFDRGKNYLSDQYDFKNGFKYVIDADVYDEWLYLAQTGWESALKEDDSWRDDWNGSEAFTAGYIMGTFNFFRNLTLIAGLRYENYNMNYRAQFTLVTHNVYGDAISTKVGTAVVPYDYYNVDRYDINYFPNFHLKYQVNGWSDMRIAYTNSIIRPDYSQIIPKMTVFPGSNYVIGNPNLKPTTAKNLDVIASVYSNIVGLFTINGFYKELEDAQYRTGIYYGNIDLYGDNVFMPDSALLWNDFKYQTKASDIVNTSLNNPNLGFIRGVELSWQTNFWYLPQPLNSLVLNVNYTKSGSNIDYRIIRNIPITVPDPNNPRKTITYFTTNDTVYSGRLLQQADDVINVALGVDYKGFSGRLSFNMRGNVLTSIGTRPEETSYTGNIYRWDFTIKQDLPIKGLSLSLNGLNIFHNGIESFRKFRLTKDSPITENLVSVLYSPTIYQFNLRYNF